MASEEQLWKEGVQEMAPTGSSWDLNLCSTVLQDMYTHNHNATGTKQVGGRKSFLHKANQFSQT